MGPRWRVHPRTNGNARGVRVRSGSAYDESSWRLDLGCHFLPATSDDFMDRDPEWDDFLGTLGHDSLTSFCIFAFSIVGRVAAVPANNREYFGVGPSAAAAEPKRCNEGAGNLCRKRRESKGNYV
jgi:hypothetical protein